MKKAALEFITFALGAFGAATIALALAPSPWRTSNLEIPCILCTEQGCSGVAPPGCPVYAGCAAIGGDDCVGCFCKAVANECLCQPQP